MNADERLEQALDAIHEREAAYGKALADYADAESEYRVQFAKAYLAAEGTEKARNSEAILKVERFLRERDRAEAVKEFCREALRDCQAAVSARQSLLSADLRTNKAFA